MPQATVDKYWATVRSGFTADIVAGLDASEPRPCPVDGYEIRSSVPATGTKEGVIAVLHRETGAVVGGISNLNFHVDPAHRGLGLGSELLRMAFTEGVKDALRNGHSLSPDGARCRRSAHRKAVERALAAGLEVPEEVLAD